MQVSAEEETCCWVTLSWFVVIVVFFYSRKEWMYGELTEGRSGWPGWRYP